MKENLANNLVNTLISETIMGSRHWHLLHYQNEIMKQENINLYNLLFDFEFHKIKYEDSFSLQFRSGYFYLLHEWSESGRDGTIYDEYNLYAQPDKASDITLVMGDSPELYRLKNAIIEKNCLPKNVENFITEFLES